MIIDDSWMATLRISRKGWCYFLESPDMRKCPECKRKFGINGLWDTAPEGTHCPFCGVKVSADNVILPLIYTTKW
jgi:rubredoxin